jgi:excisionase family DNA binding protein
MNNQTTPLLLTVKDVCRLLHIGRTRFYQLRQSGAFAPKVLTLGGKLLIKADELAEWVKADMPPLREWQARQATTPPIQLRGGRK